MSGPETRTVDIEKATDYNPTGFIVVKYILVIYNIVLVVILAVSSLRLILASALLLGGDEYLMKQVDNPGVYVMTIKYALGFLIQLFGLWGIQEEKLWAVVPLVALSLLGWLGTWFGSVSMTPSSIVLESVLTLLYATLKETIEQNASYEAIFSGLYS